MSVSDPLRTLAPREKFGAMERRRLVARVDTKRAGLALLLPLAAATFIAWRLSGSGYSLSDAGLMLGSNPIIAVGIVALIFWVWRYYPPALHALCNGPHLLTADARTLFMPHREVALEDVRSINVRRGFWRKTIEVTTASDQFSFSALFVPEADDRELRELGAADRWS